MEPIIKWVGGKRWLAPNLTKRIQQHLSGTYYEPFVGSGAIFFHLAPKDAILCDALEALTWTFVNIRDDAMAVSSHLQAVADNANSQENFYIRRDRFNSLLSHGRYDAEFAALFIYLNKTGFNGLWRQNRIGEFNVPFGNYKKIRIPNTANLLQASKILRGSHILTMTSPKNVFDVIDETKQGDVIFADPPYLDTYQGYDGLFASGHEFQEALAITLWQAVRRGVTVFATNNDCPEIRKWYGAFAKLETYNRSQSIAGKVEGRKRWNQILAVGIP